MQMNGEKATIRISMGGAAIRISEIELKHGIHGFYAVILIATIDPI